MALILNIETSTEVCSVALSSDGNLLSLSEELKSNSHSSKLTTLIQQVLSQAGKDARELSAVAVSAGPGSFTGLRIGASAAKGLCYALDIPLLAIPTLLIMVFRVKEQLMDKDALYLPVLPSIKNEIFCGLYDFSLTEVINPASHDIRLEIFKPYLISKKVVLCGNSPETSPLPSYDFIQINTSAKNMIDLSNRFFQIGKFEPVVSFEPLYLKKFIPKT